MATFTIRFKVELSGDRLFAARKDGRPTSPTQDMDDMSAVVRTMAEAAKAMRTEESRAIVQTIEAVEIKS